MEDISGDECLLFRRGALRYGIPLTDLKEIKRITQGWTPLPGISEVIRGIISVSGRLTSIHDLATFNGEERPEDIPYLLVAQSKRDGLIGLACDEIDGINYIDMRATRSLPVHLSEYTNCYTGMTDQDRLIINLNGLIENETFFNA
jgi:chemotaxis signal transduction protein